MKGAYKQIPRHPSEANIAIVMFWHPARACWMFAELDTLAFGESGSVLLFNRVPTFITAAARRWLAIPVQHFFDDFRILGLKVSGGDEFQAFAQLAVILGWKFDDDKDQLPTPCLPMLGNLEEFTPDEFMLRARPDRIEAIRCEINTMLQQKRMPSEGLKSLRGKLLHFSNTMPGRRGRGFMFGINPAISDGEKWLNMLESNLRNILATLSFECVKTVPLISTIAKQFRIWTDASCSGPASSPIVKVSVIACDVVSGWKQGLVCELPQEVFAPLNERATQILVGELLGPMLAIKAFPDLFSNASGIAFIDNISIRCSIVNGSARAADLAVAIFGLHFVLAARVTTVFWEWIPGASDPSDGGSRVGVNCRTAKACGCVLYCSPWPGWPRNFPHSAPNDWAVFWNPV